MPPAIAKEAQFLLFTDWDHPPAKSAQREVENWPPFLAANPLDVPRVKDLKQAINRRIDGRLGGSIESADRIYFRHTNVGIDLVGNGDGSWDKVQGAIIDPDTTARGQNAEKLSRVTKNLARQAPEYLRLRSKVLICLLPSAAGASAPAFPAATVLEVKKTASSQDLMSEVVTWLTALNVHVDDDRMNATKELRDAVEEFLEKKLI
jgi:hypothetical protein